ncbi:hypothetical protein BCU70_06990 [Vibrio sp. 10N.286.49.C2]|uniref:DUF3859 domain-containing protein n=1 Tax=unclassified Vibrio TaxID=2614977 RepID=UPI000C8202A6|nr:MULTISPECIES: DUF3859 domain-containing protein [unclassified Vibrio]PMH31629.1 hypothetical protein BCU70_06990 [Vibrio sp. 10N.286.49.C2]PMH50651.1 hypothetical protein BCU66_19350 [Vibrio sp. 10N.286.49.B1]PMH79318.1 hypothetical protein BCU58_05790 [Vibrio sp. 10N.286.48.B7]
MAKRSSTVEMTSYGIYSTWDSGSKELPKIQEFTTTVTADEHVEFGFTVNIKKAKGERIQFCIFHPGIVGKKGQILDPFDGEEHINSNDWDFYLGDTIQLLHPTQGLESNLGEWRMEMTLQGKIVAQKKFKVIARDEGQFWKYRGF